MNFVSGSDTNKALSIVVPVYNSEQTLPLLHERLTNVLLKYNEEYEIIFIEDCSSDNSWEIIKQLVKTDKRVSGFRLGRNYGQHNALLCGIHKAKYGIIVTIDDDLQNPPEEIPNLIETFNKGYDVVYGTPVEEKHGLLRDLASRITKYVLQGAMGAQTARNVSAFRVFRTSLRDAFKNYSGSFVSIDVLLTWGTTRFTAQPVEHEERKIGVSNYTFRKLITHAMNMITGFSVLPLQIASVAGFFFALFGVGVFCMVVIRYFLQGTPVPGWPFLASIIAIFSGAQLFTLGIMGEYLARIHFRSMGKPAYSVRENAK
jgi:glycosyltransferase involved in cell wall biosynthesis